MGRGRFRRSASPLMGSQRWLPYVFKGRGVPKAWERTQAVMKVVGMPPPDRHR